MVELQPNPCRNFQTRHGTALELCAMFHICALKKTPVPCIGGHLSREVLRSLPGVKDGGLVRKYIDKSGKKRHVGVAAKLKQSQRLCCTYLLMCMGCTVRLQI